MPYQDFTEEEIALRLAQAAGEKYFPDPSLRVAFPPGYFSAPTRPAAVLVPFIRFQDEWHVLFTRRTDTLPEHPGQVAFPGGRADPEDSSPEFTALREAREEIGLPEENVRILGRLEPFITVTNYLVTPVIGAIRRWPIPLQIEEVEVKRVFTIPLSWLADRSHREVRMRVLPFPHTELPVFYYQLYDDELLWGVSAQITVHLLMALGLEDTLI